MLQCPICQNNYPKLISLSIHYRSTHKKKARDLYIALYCDGKEPTCKCGCGEPVKFLDITRGFSEYKWGHAAKIPGKNNWGNNPKARANSHKTLTEMIKNKTYIPYALKETGRSWNYGLTKETNAKLLEVSENAKANEDLVRRRSELMSKNRKNGVMPTLRGPGSPAWKGGISPLNHYCHANHRFFKEWKYPIFAKYGFKCVLCDSIEHLEVHHNKETFSEILRKIAAQFNWTENYAISLENPTLDLVELKERISEAVVQYHIDNKVSGILLCETCHETAHQPNDMLAP